VNSTAIFMAHSACSSTLAVASRLDTRTRTYPTVVRVAGASLVPVVPHATDVAQLVKTSSYRCLTLPSSHACALVTASESLVAATLAWRTKQWHR